MTVTRKFFVKANAENKKAIVKALRDMGFEVTDKEWYTEEEFHLNYFDEGFCSSNGYHGWAEDPETMEEYPAVEYVLSNGKLVPKGEEQPEVSEFVKLAVREKLESVLRKYANWVGEGRALSDEELTSLKALNDFIA